MNIRFRRKKTSRAPSQHEQYDRLRKCRLLTFYCVFSISGEIGKALQLGTRKSVLPFLHSIFFHSFFFIRSLSRIYGRSSRLAKTERNENKEFQGIPSSQSEAQRRGKCVCRSRKSKYELHTRTFIKIGDNTWQK